MTHYRSHKMIALTMISALLLGACASPSQTKQSSQPAPTLSRVQQQAVVQNSTIPNGWVEIDTQAFEYNLDAITTHLQGKASMCVVMKADAYGHGIDNLMPSILKKQVPCVGITSNQEAKQIRNAGFKGTLMRLRSATLEEMQEGIKFDLEEMFGNLQTAQYANEMAKKAGKTIKYHLMLNSTGMNRNGLEVSSKQGQSDALNLMQLSNLKLTGIMTHFPVEEREDVLNGVKKFTEQSNWLIKQGKLNRNEIILHTANSFATLEVPEAWFDMVRPGALVYNYFDDDKFKHLFTFKTKVASVNSYLKGSTVGYGRSYTLKRDAKLANLPIGYSDGYLRSFSESKNSYVLINGQKAPVVGKVSMNTTMVDVTDIKDVKPGDEVVLFGKQGNEMIDYSTMADMNPDFVENTLWGKLLPIINKK